ncbi:chemotaxis response regulator protein-glutamate methylesterase [Simiduia curdlanivorans]|uniref:Protein-glutamate methylesterase/protein-glutamine glutaminase n=1 Tax=Simiduia curdlanivorans TaxID=1492769 RepID=A0ABV8VAR1_9GAMM|nr:chemotaxis response regulator protein-glutamate methylesterase [Simiduia curdlanivorans]MDN3639880.1 chemotaxis response regulator protein-glutamate methylesterase [Simiduia curdlanivorans]
MVIKVLIVDDSNFFQQRLKEMIGSHPQLQVVGIAANGREAIEKAKQLKPDVITMDYEMPMMDGVSAVKFIMQDCPTPILMFSSLTYEGARTTLDALDAGAVDFLPKNFSEVSRNSEALKAKLHQKIIAIAKPKADISIRSVTPAKIVEPKPSAEPLKDRIKLILIGASTGGPLAISEVIKGLPKNFTVPIILVLHMPENFTRAYADRLDKQSSLSVREAESGDILKPGVVYLAPGGRQLMLDPSLKTIQVIAGDDRVNYRPCVDISFASAAKCFGHQVLAIVLTGMGSDGKEGARLIKSRAGTVWTQDEASCIIYGMPQAIVREGLSDRTVKLSELSGLLVKEL